MERPADQSGVAPVRVQHFLTIGVWVLVIVTGLYFLAPLKVFLLGVLAAGAMASALQPLMHFIPANRWLRAAAVGMVPILGALALVALLTWLLSVAIADQLRQWPQIQQQLDSALATWSRRFHVEQPLRVTDLVGQLGNLLIGQGGLDVFSTTTAVLGNLVIAVTFVLLGGIFLLGEKPDRLLKPILLLAPAAREGQVRSAFAWLVPKLRWWVIGTLISMTVVAVVSGIGYSIAGLEMAIPVALLTGISEIVPTFGPITAFAVALVLAVAQGSGTIVGVVVVYVIVQLLESYLLTPYVMKRAAEMPPVVTLFTIVLWGQVFGLPGVLLAVPINLVAWAFVDHLLLRPRQAMRSGREAPA